MRPELVDTPSPLDPVAKGCVVHAIVIIGAVLWGLPLLAAAVAALLCAFLPRFRGAVLLWLTGERGRRTETGGNAIPIAVLTPDPLSASERKPRRHRLPAIRYPRQ